MNKRPTIRRSEATNTEKRICYRCGQEEGKNPGNCSGWGYSTRRHYYVNSPLKQKEMPKGKKCLHYCHTMFGYEEHCAACVDGKSLVDDAPPKQTAEWWSALDNLINEAHSCGFKMHVDCVKNGDCSHIKDHVHSLLSQLQKSIETLTKHEVVDTSQHDAPWITTVSLNAVISKINKMRKEAH